MSKSKTVLKFATATFLLGWSIAVVVTYFPYVALAIQSGVVVSTAPIVVFAISAIVALVSAITLTVFTVSTIRNKAGKGKPNEVDGESKSESKDEGKGLVQGQDVPISPLLPQEPEELVAPVLRQSVDDSVEGTETLQPENVVVNGDSAEQQTSPTDPVNGSLPSTPSASPLNSIYQFQSFPNPPSGEHNSSGGSSSPVQNHERQTRVKVVCSGTEDSLPPSPSASPLNSIHQFQSFPNPPSGEHNSSGGSSNPFQGYRPRAMIPAFYNSNLECESFGSSLDYSEQGFSSLPLCLPERTLTLNDAKLSLRLRAALDERKRQQLNQTDSEEEVQEGYGHTTTDSCVSWGTDWDGDSMMSLSLHQHTLSFGIPLITEEEEGASTHLQELRVNQRGRESDDEDEKNLNGFAITSGGARLY